nr:putative ribonuclease H-like domain-containing protein [Tanacetum cinerariifolium]
MAFISSSKNSSGNEEDNIVGVPTASTQVSTAGTTVAPASISLDTAYAYIASQFNGYWKKTGKKIFIQGTDVVGFDKSKVECFNCHKIGHFARKCRNPRSQDRGRRDNYRQGSKVDEQTPKALMAIDGERRDVPARMGARAHGEVGLGVLVLFRFYIHNHKDDLGKFDEKANDGYFLGYLLVSKAFRVFNTRRQQTKETYHIIFDEIPNDIKFLKPSVDNINITKNERYPPDEYLHPYESSQRLFLKEEPKKVSEALQHLGRVDAMQEELNQFARNKAWTLVPIHYVKTPMVPPNKLGPDLKGKAVNETQYKEVLKEMKDLKTKVKNWQNSSKNLSRLLNTQMSANDKFGLGYGDYIYGSILSYENKVLQSMFMNKECDLEDTPVNDRYTEGMHAVPPPMTGNYMPSRPDVKIDYSKFTYGPKPALVDESDTKTYENASCESDSSEYESDSDEDSVSNVQESIEKTSFAFTDSVKHAKTSRENVKEIGTPNHCPKVKKQGRNGHTRKGLGYTRKACFVWGSFNHLIRDCDFYEKRKAKQAALTKSKEKVTGQRENRLVWNNVQRVNHLNKFVPLVLLTKTGRFPVNAARQNFFRQATSTSTASKVNTARPFVNETRPKIYFYKSHSPNKRHFHNKTAQRTTFSYYKVNIVNTSLSAVKGNGDTVVKASTDCNWRNKSNSWDKVFKYNTGSKISKSVKDPQCKLKCSRHMKGNKAYLVDYQEFKGGSVAFGGSNGRITCKRKIKAGSTAGPSIALNDGKPLYSDGPLMPHLEDIYASPSGGIFIDSSYDNEGVVTVFNSLDMTRNKKDERGVVVRNKARLVAQGHRQEEGIDYDEVFAPVARIEAISIFLAFASYMGFIVYQMDVKSAFLYGTIDEELYVIQPPGFVNPKFPNKSWCDEFEESMKNRFQMSSMGELTFFLGLQVKQKEDGIFISQDKYVVEILKKFDFLSVKTASTPIKTQKPLVKDAEAADVDILGYSQDFTPSSYEEDL